MYLTRTIQNCLLLGIALLFLSGCQFELLPMPDATAPAQEEAVQEPTAEPVEEPTEVPTEEPTATPEPTATAEATATAVPTEVPTATVEPTPEPQAFTATIAVPTLNIRGGPGTNYPIVGSAPREAVFEVVGQVLGCQWYLIEHPELGDAWIAGTAQFIASSGDCSEVIEVANPPAPPAAAAPAPAAPAPAEPPAQNESGENPELPADQGCYLFQNQLGPELTITFTRSDGNWSDTITVTKDKDELYCFAPSRYTITVDAPPPWGQLNSEIKVNAGDAFYYPIRPGE